MSYGVEGLVFNGSVPLFVNRIGLFGDRIDAHLLESGKPEWGYVAPGCRREWPGRRPWFDMCRRHRHQRLGHTKQKFTGPMANSVSDPQSLILSF